MLASCQNTSPDMCVKLKIERRALLSLGILRLKPSSLAAAAARFVLLLLASCAALAFRCLILEENPPRGGRNETKRGSHLSFSGRQGLLQMTKQQQGLNVGPPSKNTTAAASRSCPTTKIQYQVQRQTQSCRDGAPSVCTFCGHAPCCISSQAPVMLEFLAYSLQRHI
jgi:hypothetical protein